MAEPGAAVFYKISEAMLAERGWVPLVVRVGILIKKEPLIVQDYLTGERFNADEHGLYLDEAEQRSFQQVLSDNRAAPKKGSASPPVAGDSAGMSEELEIIVREVKDEPDS